MPLEPEKLILVKNLLKSLMSYCEIPEEKKCISYIHSPVLCQSKNKGDLNALKSHVVPLNQLVKLKNTSGNKLYTILGGSGENKYSPLIKSPEKAVFKGFCQNCERYFYDKLFNIDNLNQVEVKQGHIYKSMLRYMGSIIAEKTNYIEFLQTVRSNKNFNGLSNTDLYSIITSLIEVDGAEFIKKELDNCKKDLKELSFWFNKIGLYLLSAEKKPNENNDFQLLKQIELDRNLGILGQTLIFLTDENSLYERIPCFVWFSEKDDKTVIYLFADSNHNGYKKKFDNLEKDLNGESTIIYLLSLALYNSNQVYFSEPFLKTGYLEKVSEFIKKQKNLNENSNIFWNFYDRLLKLQNSL